MLFRSVILYLVICFHTTYLHRKIDFNHITRFPVAYKGAAFKTGQPNIFLAMRAMEAAPAVWELEGPIMFGPSTSKTLINVIDNLFLQNDLRLLYHIH